jgi:hypothetical protein
MALSSQHVGPHAPEDTSWVGPATPQEQAFFDARRVSLASSASNFANYQPGAIDANPDTHDDNPFSFSMVRVGVEIEGNEPVVPSIPSEGISAQSQAPPVGDCLGDNLADFFGFGDDHELWGAAEEEEINQGLFDHLRTPEYSTLSLTYCPQPGVSRQ